jgi:heterodisulfide reductase subunit C
MHADHEHAPADTLARRLEAETGVKLAHCYQCGKCAAGCPLAEAMDRPPSQILRLLQLGFPQMEARALASESLWLCLACEACSARCPQEVALPKVMDFLRQEAVRRGLAHPKSRDILAFHRAFLDSIRTTGRLYEVGLVAGYKVRTRHLLKDVALAPRMYLKGKLGLFPHRIGNREGMKRLFDLTTTRR